MMIEWCNPFTNKLFSIFIDKIIFHVSPFSDGREYMEATVEEPWIDLYRLCFSLMVLWQVRLFLSKEQRELELSYVAWCFTFDLTYRKHLFLSNIAFVASGIRLFVIDLFPLVSCWSSRLVYNRCWYFSTSRCWGYNWSRSHDLGRWTLNWHLWGIGNAAWWRYVTSCRSRCHTRSRSWRCRRWLHGSFWRWKHDRRCLLWTNWRVHTRNSSINDARANSSSPFCWRDRWVHVDWWHSCRRGNRSRWGIFHCFASVSFWRWWSSWWILSRSIVKFTCTRWLHCINPLSHCCCFSESNRIDLFHLF